jgi:hypothetical protein
MASAFYWIAQAVFVVVAYLTVTKSDPLSEKVLIGSAAIQFVLVCWRLWIAGASTWLALAPPVSTVACWYVLGHWGVREGAEWGGDAAGLLTTTVPTAWCVLAYVTLAIWAGFRPGVARR